MGDPPIALNIWNVGDLRTPPRHATEDAARHIQNRLHWKRWGGDSNPWYPIGYTGFQDRRLQPLGHPTGGWKKS